MALQATKIGVITPYFLFGGNNSFTSNLIDASGEKYAAVIAVPKSGTISKVCFRTGAVSNSQTLKVTLQTVDMATGFPTGTLYGGSASGTQASPAANTFYTVTLGTGATAIVGDIIAVVIEFNATVGSVNIVDVTSSQFFPQSLLYTGSWAKNQRCSTVSLEYSDGSYEFLGTYPVSALETYTYNNGSTPDEYAVRFSVPYKCSISGAWLIVQSPVPDFDVVLYEGTTALQTVSFDKDLASGSGSNFRLYIAFSTYQVLTPNTEYFISFKPTTATNLIIFGAQFASAALLDSVGGQNIHYATRTDAGAWTKDTTRKINVVLPFDRLSDDVMIGAGIR